MPTPPPPAERYCSAGTKGQWSDLSANLTTPDGTAETTTILRRELSELLLSQNLVVLCGLGTSLCVKGNASAPTMDGLWTAAEAKAGAGFAAVIQAVKYDIAANGKNIELLLSRCLLAHRLNGDPEVKTFTEQTEAEIVRLVNFIQPDTDLGIHETFLRKLGRRPTTKPRLKVFTTNYDLCLEEAAARTRFIAIDGFSPVAPHVFDGMYYDYDYVKRGADRELPEYLTNVYHLYKLHGSLHWTQTGEQTLRDPTTKKPCIIYPRDSKFESSYEQPFLEMMSRFQTAIREPNTGLIVVGFGCNDRHIVQPLSMALASNINLRVLLVDPSIEKKDNATIKRMNELVKQGDSRLSLLETGFEKFVTLLPDLVTRSDSEAHFERFAKPVAKS